jgi:hypothetical protein
LVLNGYKTFNEHLLAVRELSQKVLRPAEKRLNRTDSIPNDLTNALKEIDLFRTFEKASQIQQANIAKAMLCNY